MSGDLRWQGSDLKDWFPVSFARLSNIQWDIGHEISKKL